MLLGLRHDAVVGGDREEDEVDAVRAGEHVADEALVPGHVDDAGARAAGEVQVGEAQVDRDAALLLLLQAVGVLTGERADERGLAVIDVTRGADDDRHAAQAAGGSRSTASSAGSRTARRSRRKRPSWMRPTHRRARGPEARRDRARGRRRDAPPRAPGWGAPPRAARRCPTSHSDATSVTRQPGPSRASSAGRRGAADALQLVERPREPAQHGKGRTAGRAPRDRAGAWPRAPRASACRGGARGGAGFAARRSMSARRPTTMPGLRPAEELVAAEGDQVRARGDALAHDRLARQAARREVDERAAPEVLQDRHARLAAERDQLRQLDRRGEADDPVVARVDLQEERGRRARRRGGSRRRACGWSCRPRAGAPRSSPSRRGCGTSRRSRPARRARPRTSRSAARVFSASSTAAALLFTTSAASAPVSARRSSATSASRSPRRPVTRSSSRLTAPRAAATSAVDRGLGERRPAEVRVAARRPIALTTRDEPRRRRLESPRPRARAPRPRPAPARPAPAAAAPRRGRLGAPRPRARAGSARASAAPAGASSRRDDRGIDRRGERARRRPRPACCLTAGPARQGDRVRERPCFRGRRRASPSGAMQALVCDVSVPRQVVTSLLGRDSTSASTSARSRPRRCKEIPEPALPATTGSCMRTRLCGICGSDYKQMFLNGSMDNPMTALISFPQVLGHEVVGHDRAVGPEVRTRRVGERVVLNPWLSCGPRGITPPCPECADGQYSICRNFAPRHHPARHPHREQQPRDRRLRAVRAGARVDVHPDPRRGDATSRRCSPTRSRSRSTAS